MCGCMRDCNPSTVEGLLAAPNERPRLKITGGENQVTLSSACACEETVCSGLVWASGHTGLLGAKKTLFPDLALLTRVDSFAVSPPQGCL